MANKFNRSAMVNNYVQWDKLTIPMQKKLMRAIVSVQFYELKLLHCSSAAMSYLSDVLKQSNRLSVIDLSYSEGIFTDALMSYL